MNNLVLITARGGSKGIPGKNIKKLAGKPLINYSLEVARAIVSNEDICVSTDDDRIIKVVEEFGLKVPFVRPEALASDTAGSYQVLLHAIDYYEAIGKQYDFITLLQPTSPFRKVEDVRSCIEAFSIDCDMVVSVKISEANPYYNLFEENVEGFLSKSKLSNAVRRQDVPPAYMYNGAVYVINVKSLKMYNGFSEFTRVKKSIMDPLRSIDLDTPMDWEYAEFLIEKGHVRL